MTITGRVGTTQELSLPTDILKDILAELKGISGQLQAQAEAFAPQTASGQSVGSPLRVALTLSGFKGRITLEVWVKSSAAATFLVEGSVDGVNFRTTDTIILAGAGEEHRGYANAFPVVRVRTDDANDNEIEIAAAR